MTMEWMLMAGWIITNGQNRTWGILVEYRSCVSDHGPPAINFDPDATAVDRKLFYARASGSSPDGGQRLKHGSS